MARRVINDYVNNELDMRGFAWDALHPCTRGCSLNAWCSLGQCGIVGGTDW